MTRQTPARQTPDERPHRTAPSRRGVGAVAASAVAVCAMAGGLVVHAPTDAEAVPPVGEVRSGRATFYSLGDDGFGNCSFPAGTITDRMYVAAGPEDYAAAGGCGSYLDVTGPKGKVRVIVADQCPECESGHLDLSQEAFAAIGTPADGIIPISYQTVRDPAVPGPLAIRVKEGSSQWWIGFLVTNHGNPLANVEYLDGSGAWVGLTRKVYNYWQKEDGAGSGPFTLRITDIYGTQATVKNIALTPQVTQDTGVWLYGAGGAAPDPETPDPGTPTPDLPAEPIDDPVPTDATCSALVDVHSWPGGYQATVTVRNTDDTAVDPWDVTWQMPDGATVTTGWNATVTQSGLTVTAAALSWNSSLASDGSVAIGFNADGPWSPGPGEVTLNGAVCAVE